MRTIPLFSFATASLLLVALSTVAQAGAKTCTAMSGDQRVALIELYTSEGCSSCPPADNWLSQLRGKGLGPDKAVPLAFHVDYWDYIGWKDRFAKPEHTERQRETAGNNRLRTIYTPQVVINGRDFRHWYWGDSAERTVDKINGARAKAKISLTLSEISNLQVRVNARIAVKPSPHPVHSVAYLALYQNRQESAVSSGENTGKKLKHNHVVRELLGPFPIRKDGMLSIDQTLNLNPSWKRADIGVAAFVQEEGTGDVLQVLAQPVCT